MSQHLILWPVLLQIGLTIAMYFRLAVVKAKELKSGNVAMKEIATNQDAWPASVRLINANLRNQFETPVLFYMLSIVLLSLHAASTTAIITACIYAGSRVIHAYVHTSKNIIPLRTGTFVLGVVALIVMLVLSVMALSAL